MLIYIAFFKTCFTSLFKRVASSGDSCHRILFQWQLCLRLYIHVSNALCVKEWGCGGVVLRLHNRSVALTTAGNLPGLWDSIPFCVLPFSPRYPCLRDADAACTGECG